MTGLNGHHIDPMTLVMMVKIEKETDRQTEIMLSQGRDARLMHRDMMHRLDKLPDRIASKMPPQSRGLDMKTLVVILQALPPLLLIATIVAAKLTGNLQWAEAVPMIRQAVGG